MLHVAVIDDDADFAYLSTSMLREEGYQVSEFASGEAFLQGVQKNPDAYDLVLCDYRLPKTDGFTVYRSAKVVGLQCPYILITAFGDFDQAVEALKAGVADYLIKPVEKGVLLRKLATYLEKTTLEEEVFFSRLGKKIVAQSEVMQEILKKLSRLAKSRASILLMGESGTGKEVMARLLHDTSARHEGRFVAVNVSAVPDTLFEAEFFGYRKGSFTDAVRDHEGFATRAHGGTLFLDEVGDLSLTAQAKLLRLLEEKKVQPLGSQDSQQVDFRLISATNRNLEDRIAKGEFRKDLYYRIAVISLNIPPLRERVEDVVPIARYLLKELAAQEGVDIIDFTPEAQEKLLHYSWPGNVRQLKNRIYEAMLATDRKWIDAVHLNIVEEESHDSELSFELAKAHFERRYILQLLKRAKGNVNRVARLSGLSRRAVYDLMKRHDILPDTFRN